MGGNALSVKTRRYEAEEYFALSRNVSTKFGLLNKVARCNIIPAYHNKQSFGDLDIIYSTYDDEPLSIFDIKSIFTVQQIIKNGSVISFDHKEFQVDLIHSKKSCYNYGLAYYSYNDLGNIGCGKLVKHFGLKHGHDGLFLPLYGEHGNKFDEILLTENHDKTLDLVALCTDKFEKGFDELNDIFEYVASSPYYNPKHYLLENVNSAGRMRDKKRETYRKFLEFGKTWKGATIESNPDKSSYLRYILDTFPEALEAYQNAIMKRCLGMVAKQKFNADMVKEWTGLEGEKLGNFMKMLKSDFDLEHTQLVLSTPEKIKSVVMKHFSWYNSVL